MLLDTEESRFKVGQVWNYQSRNGEEDSLLTVVKTETHPVNGHIIHIHLRGVRVKSPYAPDGICGEISHLPLSEDAVAASVKELLSTVENLPDYQDGYRQWRQAFDAQKAGIWTIPVAECVEALEQAINNSPTSDADGQ